VRHRAGIMFACPWQGAGPAAVCIPRGRAEGHVVERAIASPVRG
jgi:hypothetical protein